MQKSNSSYNFVFIYLVVYEAICIALHLDVCVSL